MRGLWISFLREHNNIRFKTKETRELKWTEKIKVLMDPPSRSEPSNQLVHPKVKGKTGMIPATMIRTRARSPVIQLVAGNIEVKFISSIQFPTISIRSSYSRKDSKGLFLPHEYHGRNSFEQCSYQPFLI